MPAVNHTFTMIFAYGLRGKSHTRCSPSRTVYEYRFDRDRPSTGRHKTIMEVLNKCSACLKNYWPHSTRPTTDRPRRVICRAGGGFP